MFCSKCGDKINTGERFCGSCGEAVNVQPVNQSMPTAVYQQEPAPADQQTSARGALSFKVLSLIALIICAILWFTAPFIAVNILTLGDQPSALQFITDQIAYIGDLTESPSFWAAVLSIVGIVLCFFCTIGNKKTATRIIAILTEIPLAIVLFRTISWVDDIKEFAAVIGLGFWWIFALLFMVIIANGKNARW